MKILLNSKLLCAFVVISFFLHVHHEPWRDEAQAWLIARDSPSIAHLLINVSFEETPGLWHLILYPFAQSNAPYVTMWVIHSIISTIAVAIILFKSPFTLIQKCCLVASYYLLFEYNIIARNYALTILILWILATLHPARLSKLFIYAGVLFFLPLTNAHSIILTLLILGWLVIDIVRIRAYRKMLHLLIPMGGLALALIWINLAGENVVPFTNWHFDLEHKRRKIEIALSVLHIAFIPTNTFAHWISPINSLKNWIGALLFAISLIVVFRPKVKIAALIYIAFTATVIIIAVFKASIGYRHYGLIFILLIYLLWVTYRSSKINNILITIIFFSNGLGGLLLIPYEYQVPFSASRQTAQAVHEVTQIQPSNLVGYPSYMLSSLVPQISQSIYALDREEYVTFTRWDQKTYQNKDLSSQIIINRIDNLPTHNSNSSTVLILTAIVDETELANLGYHKLSCYHATIMYEEWYCLFTKPNQH